MKGFYPPMSHPTSTVSNRGYGSFGSSQFIEGGISQDFSPSMHSSSSDWTPPVQAATTPAPSQPISGFNWPVNHSVPDPALEENYRKMVKSLKYFIETNIN